MTNSIELVEAPDRDPERTRIADEAANWLAKLSGEQASEGDFDAYREWRNASGAHAEAFDRVATTYASLGEYADAPEIVEMRLAALAQTPQQFDPDRNWVRFGALAASICFAFLIGVYVMLANGPDSELGSQGPSLAAAQSEVTPTSETDIETPSAADENAAVERFRTDYSTRIGQIAEFTLPDGSVIALNTGSQVQVDFKEGRRDLTLVRGEAVFTVAKDRNRPFTVRAGQSRVVALGTVFTVRKTGSDARVTLIEGRVRVEQDGATNREASTQLAPGEQISILSNRPAEITRMPIAQVASWRDGRLIFEQTPLNEVLEEFNRYSIEQYVLRDDSIADYLVSGTFRIKSSEYFAATLEAGFPVVVRARSNGSVLEVAAAEEFDQNQR